MNGYLLIDGVIAVAFLMLSALALTNHGARRPLNRQFIGLSLFMLVWLVSNQISNTVEYSEQVVTVADYFVFGSSFATSIMLVTLIATIANIEKTTRIVRVSQPFMWLLALLSATPLVAEGVVREGNSYSVVFGPAPWLFVLGIAVVLGIGCYVMWVGMRRASRGRHEQLKIVGMSALTSVVLSFIIGFVLPPVLDDYEIYQLAVAPGGLLAVALYIGVVRHKLFDIRLAAVRTVAYIFSLMTLSLIYVGMAYLLSITMFKENVTTGISVSPANVLTALALAFAFQPVKSFFDRITDNIFYRDRYTQSEFVSRLGQTLTTVPTLKQLSGKVTREIGLTLKASFCEMIVFDAEAGLEQRGRYTLDARTSRWPIDTEVLSELLTMLGARPIIVEAVSGMARLRHAKILHSLTENGVVIIVPLMQGNTVIGCLLLGEHQGSGYVKQDMATLGIITDELVIAVQNAKAVQEVRDLNASLQQRIDDATKELRDKNAELERLDGTKDEFISMASHQLRTPLTSIKGYLSMVLDGDVGKITDDQRKLLTETFESSERMVRLIGDFLNVSRIQTGKFILDTKPVDLALVIQQEIESIKPMAAAHSMVFSFRAPARFPVLYLDEAKIRQVIMNFLDNAMYYSHAGTKTIVRLSVEGGDAVFTVRDHGIGVPRAQQRKLFTKFFRATNARTHRPDGTGVGLYLAKKVVLDHGGEIIFESEENKGCTFGFRLNIKRLSKPTE